MLTSLVTQVAIEVAHDRVLRSPRSDSIEDRARWSSERTHAVDQDVDQLVGKFADEMALPVVAIDAVSGIEDPLLVEETVAADPVGDQARP
jgi:hypothetical protein